MKLHSNIQLCRGSFFQHVPVLSVIALLICAANATGCKNTKKLTKEKVFQGTPVGGKIEGDYLFIDRKLHEEHLDFQLRMNEKCHPLSRKQRFTVIEQKDKPPIPYCHIYSIDRVENTALKLTYIGKSNKYGEICLPLSLFQKGILIHQAGFHPMIFRADIFSGNINDETPDK